MKKKLMPKEPINENKELIGRYMGKLYIMSPHKSGKEQMKKSKNKYSRSSNKSGKEPTKIKEKETFERQSVFFKELSYEKIAKMTSTEYKIYIIEYMKMQHPSLFICVDSSRRWIIDCLSIHFQQYHVHIDDAIILVRKIMRFAK